MDKRYLRVIIEHIITKSTFLIIKINFNSKINFLWFKGKSIQKEAFPIAKQHEYQ